MCVPSGRRFPKGIAGIWAVAIVLLLSCPEAYGGGKFGFYGLHMSPNGADAEDYSSPGWGGGMHVVVPIPQTSRLLAGTAGLEVTNLLSETVLIPEALGLFYAKQTTDQTYTRFYLGTRVGPHGKGFFRPFVGVNVAVVHYSINTELSVPNETSDPEDDDVLLRQTMFNDSETEFGYDLTLGVDLNFFNKICAEGGVRYMKTFGLAQQLGGEAVDISPEYFQFYLGVGIAFQWVMEWDADEEEGEGQEGGVEE